MKNLKWIVFSLFLLGWGQAAFSANDVDFYLAYGDARFAALNGANVGDPLSESIPVNVPGLGEAFTLQYCYINDAPFETRFGGGEGFIGYDSAGKGQYGRGEAGRAAADAAATSHKLLPAIVADQFGTEHDGEFNDGRNAQVTYFNYVGAILFETEVGVEFGSLGAVVAFAVSETNSSSLGWWWHMYPGTRHNVYSFPFTNRDIELNELYGDDQNENGLTLNSRTGFLMRTNLLASKNNGQILEHWALTGKKYILRGAEQSLAGTVQFGDFLGDTTQENIGIDVVDPNTHQLIKHIDAKPKDASGAIQVALKNIQPGTYDINMRGTHWITSQIRDVKVTYTGASGVNFSLINGDCDADNTVSIFDYIILSESWGKKTGETGFDKRADLDGDGKVGAFDLLIISNNFDKSGV